MLRLAPALIAVVTLACNLACNKEQPPPSPPVTATPADDVGTPAPDDGAATDPETAGDDGVPATEPVANKAVGESCLAADECSSGICEGEGCGEETPGTCADASRMCTRDLRQYCGCDGTSFGASGSCPGQRYAHKDPC